MAAGTQNAGDFGKEAWKVRVAVGGFDVDDGVERGIGEGQFLSVALDEVETGHAMLLLAEADTGGVDVQAGVVGWAEVACDPGGTAAVATAHFEDVFAAKIDLRGDVMVELDAGAIGLIFVCQIQADRRVGLIGVVEKVHVFLPETLSEKRIPQPPNGFANGGDGEEAFEGRHASGSMAADSFFVILFLA